MNILEVRDAIMGCIYYDKVEFNYLLANEPMVQDLCEALVEYNYHIKARWSKDGLRPNSVIWEFLELIEGNGFIVHITEDTLTYLVSITRDFCNEQGKYYYSIQSNTRI